MPFNRSSGDSIRRLVKNILKSIQIGSKKKSDKVRYVKGVKNGNYYRRKIIKPEKVPVAQVPKIPKVGQQLVPQPLKNVPPPPPTPDRTIAETISKRIYDWFKENAAVLILNFGSIFTLIGFTRQDVLELRLCSVTGSVSSIIYFLSQRPFKLAPILWSSAFAFVNSYKISNILYERKGTVVLSDFDQDVFTEHFMAHGVTPKQFEIIKSKSRTVHYKKGEVIISQGQGLSDVYLVVSGHTVASRINRRLSVLSTEPGARNVRSGGDAGAWFGEMTFLEKYGRKVQLQNKKNFVVKNQKSKERVAPEEEIKEEKTLPLPSSTKDETSSMQNSSNDRHTDNSKDDENSNKVKKEEEEGYDGYGLVHPFLPPVRVVTKKVGEVAVEEDENEEEDDDDQPMRLGRAMYTVRCREDCEVLIWSHEDIEKLMNMSSDMKASMTRAMTAPIVGKVINFTVAHKSRHIPLWSNWLTSDKSLTNTLMGAQKVNVSNQRPKKNIATDMVQ